MLVVDILGRKVNDYDLVLGMTIGRHSDGMRHGVFLGKSVYWQRSSWVTKSTLSNMYLIENPTEAELKIKEEIIDSIKKEQEDVEKEKQRKKETKKLSKKDIKINAVYKDLNGYNWLYLGKKKVTILIDREVRFEKTGEHCYIREYNLKRYLEFKDGGCTGDIVSTWNGISTHIDFLKTPKQFVEKIEDNIIIPNEYKGYGSGYYGREKTIQMTIEDVN